MTINARRANTHTAGKEHVNKIQTQTYELRTYVCVRVCVVPSVPKREVLSKTREQTFLFSRCVQKVLDGAMKTSVNGQVQ